MRPEGKRVNHYDVAVLVNSNLPMVHVSSKRRGVDMSARPNQPDKSPPATVSGWDPACSSMYGCRHQQWHPDQVLQQRRSRWPSGRATAKQLHQGRPPTVFVHWLVGRREESATSPRLSMASPGPSLQNILRCWASSARNCVFDVDRKLLVMRTLSDRMADMILPARRDQYQSPSAGRGGRRRSAIWHTYRRRQDR